jgi:hypothetical protein
MKLAINIVIKSDSIIKKSSENDTALKINTHLSGRFKLRQNKDTSTKYFKFLKTVGSV